MGTSVYGFPGLIQASGTTVTVPGALAFPLGTSITEPAAGTLATVNASATNAFNIPNGSLPEFGGMDWDGANFFEIGTTTNSGTARAVRVKSIQGQIVFSNAGSDKYVFVATGATKYAGLTAVGLGNPVVVQQQRTLATVNATSTLTAFTVGAADGTFLVSSNVNVTAVSTAAMTCTCTYTDETNTSRVATFQFEQNGTATYISSITNVTGTGAYASSPLFIQCKAATTITIATAGTVTGITYNLGGLTVQLV